MLGFKNDYCIIYNEQFIINKVYINIYSVAVCYFNSICVSGSEDVDKGVETHIERQEECGKRGAVRTLKGQ